MLLEALLAQLLAEQGPRGGKCPADMALVEGAHHETLERYCNDFHMDHCFAFEPGFVARESPVVPIRTCMDTYEWPNQKGAEPEVMTRFVEAEKKCAGAGKRLCSEYEWETACEGPDATPFPYGYAHVVNACNSDKPYRTVSEAKLSSNDKNIWERETKRLWQGDPSGAHPQCKSSFGVFDLTGNVEEWVTRSRPEWPYRSALKGGYWSKPWAGCRGTNERHGEMFRFYEIGFRCCKDPE